MSKIHFASGVVVAVTEATTTAKPKGAQARFACPGCGTKHDVTVTGGDLPRDFVFACEVEGCGHIGSLEV